MIWEKFWEAAERRESACEGSSGLGLEGFVCVAEEEGLSGDEGEVEVWAGSDGSLASLEPAFWSEGGGGGGGGGGWLVE